VREAIASLNTPKQNRIFSTLALRWGIGFLLLLLLVWGVIFPPVWITNNISFDRPARPTWIDQSTGWVTRMADKGRQAMTPWSEQGLAWFNDLISGGKQPPSQPPPLPQTVPLPAPLPPSSPLPEGKGNTAAPAGEPAGKNVSPARPSPIVKGSQ